MDAPVPKLPDEAIQALRQGQKVHAIRIVRERQGLDLAAAKDAVEAAIAADPWLRKQCEGAAPSRGRRGLRLSTVVLAIAAAVMAWLRFTGRF